MKKIAMGRKLSLLVYDDLWVIYGVLKCVVQSTNKFGLHLCAEFWDSSLKSDHSLLMNAHTRIHKSIFFVASHLYKNAKIHALQILLSDINSRLFSLWSTNTGCICAGGKLGHPAFFSLKTKQLVILWLDNI